MECKLRNCKKKPRARGFCKTHYHQEIFLKTHPLWATYQNMLRRCYQPTHPRYKDWGGKGVRVCKYWRENYFNFTNDIGPRPTPFHQLELINRKGNYEPENCRWTTSAQQSINRHKRIDNKSGTVGVMWNKRVNKWQAVITVNKHRYHLGWFVNKIDAKNARELAEIYYADTGTL